MSEMKPYIVRQGEYLAKIAGSEGIDGEHAWAHGKNCDLAAVRLDPQVLLPGDILHIPARDALRSELVLAGTNGFVGEVPRVEVAIELRGDGQALADEACIVEGLGDEREERTDGRGRVVVRVPVNTSAFILRVRRTGVRYRFLVGFLDPIDSSTGRAARLANLGFLPDVGGAEAGRPGREVELAAEHFESFSGRSAATGSAEGAQQALLVAAGM